MQTHLFGEDTASKSCLYSQNITSLILAVLFLKERLWSVLKEKGKGEPNIKQPHSRARKSKSINCTQFFLLRVCYVLGQGKTATQNLVKP